MKTNTTSLATILGCLFLSTAIAQNGSNHAPESDMKYYVADNGYIYWNKHLPVYLNLSSSPGGDNGLTMRQATASAVEPYYFDTEGINWIRTRWAVNLDSREILMPKKEIMWPVMADGLPPITKASFGYSGKHSQNGKIYYSGDLTITLLANDQVAGVDAIYYSLGNEFQRYDSEIKVAEAKSWTLQYYAIDNVGNKEPLHDERNKSNFIVDDAAPTTNLVVLDPKSEDILSPKSKISLGSRDTGSGIRTVYYRINEDRERIYSSEFDLSLLKEGDNTIHYYAKDNVNNLEKASSYKFFLDKTPPQLNYEVIGDQYKDDKLALYVSKRSKLKVIGTDSKAGVEGLYYRFDASGEYLKYSQTLPTEMAPGIHSLSYYGKDMVENQSRKMVAYFVVDVDSPALGYKTTGPNFVRNDTLFVRNTTEFTLWAYEAGQNQSGVKEISYEIDGNSQKYNGNFTINGDGNKVLTIETLDNVNNLSSKHQTLFVDNLPPTITSNLSVEAIGSKKVRNESFVIYPKEVQVYLAATDANVGTESIYYKINEGIEKLYDKPIKHFKKGANVSIEIRAIDILGNESRTMLVFSVE